MAINKNLIIDKKVATGVLIVTILGFGLILGWATLQEKKKEAPPGEITKEEINIEKELRKLEELREGIPPLTEKEIQKQIEELKELRQSQ